VSKTKDKHASKTKDKHVTKTKDKHVTKTKDHKLSMNKYRKPESCSKDPFKVGTQAIEKGNHFLLHEGHQPS
jgi:hypothetical protein